MTVELNYKEMKNKREKYTDNSGDRKYYTMIPNYVINHSTAYEQALYLTMKRIAGEKGTCWASPITIGKMMGVSANTIRKYRDKLLKRGWIKCIGEKGKTKPTYEFEIVDLWKLNVDFYTKKESSTIELSKKESSTGEEKVQLVSLVSSTVGNKEEHIKNNQEEDIGLASANQQIKRKNLSFSKDWYNQVIQRYQELKGIQLKGNEFLPVQQVCKTIFMSGRLPKEIIACMEFIASSGNEVYSQWTINTIFKKLPEFLAGKLNL